MVTTLVVLVIAIFIGLAMSGIVFNDVYKILKLANHEVDVDIIKFDKCILPYRR